MKILHYSPRLRAGSPMIMAADLACALQRLGLENIVVSPTGEHISRLVTAGVRHIFCRRPNLLTAWREIHRIRSIVRRQVPSVLQVYSADAAWIAGLACKRISPRRRPMILGALTGYPRVGTTSVGWHYCDAYTSVSRNLRQAIETSPTLNIKRPWVIPYGVNDELCYPGYTPANDWRKQWESAHLHTNEGKLTLCIPCSITPLHGLEDLVPILTGLLRTGIPAHAYIVADTRHANKAYRSELQQTFNIAHLSEHITWLGARADLRDVLCACDATLSLARQPATWNRAILEALALGRPVVGYDHGVVGEYLTAFLPEGRVAPGDTAAIIDTLTQWRTYSPAPVAEIPYPYKLSDTAETYKTLYNDITSKKQQ